jgi:uncharacterized membrane protein
MRMLFLQCLIFISVCSCNNSAVTESTTTVQDTAGLINDSTPQQETFTINAADSVLFGFYQGLLPCTNCEGIRHTLLLKDSAKFILEEFTIGESTFPTRREGRWTHSGDSIQLLANQKLLATYLADKDTLRLKYLDGRPMADSAAQKHWLARIPDAAKNKAWIGKKNQGVEFYGIGTEPFWSIEIDEGKNASFKTADLSKAIVLAYSSPSSNKDSTTYNLKTADNVSMQVVVYNQFCNDGMSDNLYEQRVHIRFKGTEFKGCGVFLH